MDEISAREMIEAVFTVLAAAVFLHPLRVGRQCARARAGKQDAAAFFQISRVQRL